MIVEVKADNGIDEAVAQARKAFAQQVAVSSGMEHRIIRATDVNERRCRLLMQRTGEALTPAPSGRAATPATVQALFWK